MGIVFGTLSPPMNPLGWVNFRICKIVYGYLYAFAETKKPDLGGVFWVTQLEHLLWGCIVYSILMTGVLWERSYASSVIHHGNRSFLGAPESLAPAIPAAMCLPTILYCYLRLRKFRTQFAWEKLPMEKFE